MTRSGFALWPKSHSAEKRKKEEEEEELAVVQCCFVYGQLFNDVCSAFVTVQARSGRFLLACMYGSGPANPH